MYPLRFHPLIAVHQADDVKLWVLSPDDGFEAKYKVEERTWVRMRPDQQESQFGMKDVGVSGSFTPQHFQRRLTLLFTGGSL